MPRPAAGPFDHDLLRGMLSVYWFRTLHQYLDASTESGGAHVRRFPLAPARLFGGMFTRGL